MLYMLQVDLLVATAIFALAGAALLAVIAVSYLKNYVSTRFAMRHTVEATAADGHLIEPLRQSL